MRERVCGGCFQTLLEERVAVGDAFGDPVSGDDLVGMLLERARPKIDVVCLEDPGTGDPCIDLILPYLDGGTWNETVPADSLLADAMCSPCGRRVLSGIEAAAGTASLPSSSTLRALSFGCVEDPAGHRCLSVFSLDLLTSVATACAAVLDDPPTCNSECTVAVENGIENLGCCFPLVFQFFAPVEGLSFAPEELLRAIEGTCEPVFLECSASTGSSVAMRVLNANASWVANNRSSFDTAVRRDVASVLLLNESSVSVQGVSFASVVVEVSVALPTRVDTIGAVKVLSQSVERATLQLPWTFQLLASDEGAGMQSTAVPLAIVNPNARTRCEEEASLLESAANRARESAPVIFMVVVLLVSNTAVVWIARRSHGGTWRFAAKSSGELFVWVINMLQIIAQVTALSTATTPGFLRFVFRMVSFVIAEFSARAPSDCGTSNFILTTNALFGAGLVLSALWTVLSFLRHRYPRSRRVLYVLGVAILLLISIQIRSVARMFDCTSESGFGRQSVLSTDPRVQCSTREFLTTRALGLVTAAVSCVCVPVLLLVLARRRRCCRSGNSKTMGQSHEADPSLLMNVFTRTLTQEELKPSYFWLRVAESGVVTLTTVAVVLTQSATQLTVTLRTVFLSAALWAVAVVVLRQDPYVPLVSWKRPVKAGSYTLAGFLTIVFAVEDARERNPDSQALDAVLSILQIVAFVLSCALVLTLLVSYYFHLLIKIHLRKKERTHPKSHALRRGVLATRATLSSEEDEGLGRIRVTLPDLWRLLAREMCSCRLARAAVGSAGAEAAMEVETELLSTLSEEPIFIPQRPASLSASPLPGRSPVRASLLFSKSPLVQASSPHGSPLASATSSTPLRSSIHQIQQDRRLSSGEKLQRGR